MGQFSPLYSGSSGNSTFISDGSRGILVDVGESYSKICQALSAVDKDFSKVGAVLITHEHTDHIKGLRVLLKKYNLPVYASAGTLEALAVDGHLDAGTTCHVIGEKEEEICGIGVTAFHTSHDAAESLGFRMETGEFSLGYATDLGVVSEEVETQLTGCDAVLLEANYDVEMMRLSRYHYALKKRVTGEKGHLSNNESAALAARLVKKGTTRIFLGHLSGENNLPDKAYQTVAAALLGGGMVQNKDYILRVASRHSPSRTMYF